MRFSVHVHACTFNAVEFLIYDVRVIFKDNKFMNLVDFIKIHKILILLRYKIEDQWKFAKITDTGWVIHEIYYPQKKPLYSTYFVCIVHKALLL